MTSTQDSIRVDRKLLSELGYAQLTADQADRLVREVYETIETLVGSTLTAGFDDSQLAEFEGYVDRHDDSGAERWLRQNRPDYRDVVKRCFNAICGELRALSNEQISTEATTFEVAGRTHGAEIANG